MAPLATCLLVSLSILLSACASGRTIPQQDRASNRASKPVKVQVLIGASFFDDLEFERTAGGSTVEVDLTEVPAFGIAGQRPLAGGRLEVGFEAGLMFSWWHDDAQVFAPGTGTVIVRLDNWLWLTDVSVGAYVSTVLADRVRLYAGVGPLLMFGYLDTHTESFAETETEFGVGGYARGGVEIGLADGSFLGLGVRGLTTTVEFEDGQAAAHVEGWQAMFTFTQRL